MRVGLIGCGGIAPAHLASYRQDGRAAVVAVADVDEARAQALAGQAGAAAYTDYREMLEKERLDAVSLLTPPASHRPICEAALALGAHVFAEKPLAATAADAQAMADAARRAGRQRLRWTVRRTTAFPAPAFSGMAVSVTPCRWTADGHALFPRNHPMWLPRHPSTPATLSRTCSSRRPRTILTPQNAVPPNGAGARH